MYHNQSCVAKGESYGNRQRHRFIRSMQRAAVNIYKKGNNYEMLVFAPGRIREYFHLDLQGNELSVSYTPPEGFPHPEWIIRKYSRSGFVRAFTLAEYIDTINIAAKYEDGVLHVGLPVIPGKENLRQEIKIN